MSDTDTAKLSVYPADSPFSRLIPPANRISILFFCIVNFLWWIGLYLYVPVLPVYIQSSGAQLGMVGVVLAAYAIPQVLLRIPIGVWSDRLGRRKPLVAAGIIFTSLGALGLGLVSTPWLLFIFRTVTGIGASMWVVFPLYFTSYYPAGDSGRAIGLISFVRSISLIAATVGGGFIADEFGLQQPFLIAALLGVFAIAALLFTREQRPPRLEAASWQSFMSTATSPLLLTVSVVAILLNFAVFTGVFGFIPIYAAEIGASSSQLGIITMINLGFSALAALAAPWVWERLSYRSAMIWGALLISVSLLVIPFTSAVPQLMAVQVSYGLGSGVLMTVLMTLSIHGIPQQQQATAMGVFQAVYAIGMLAGPLVSGFLGSSFGLSTVFYLTAIFSLLVAIMAFLPVFSRRSIQ